MTFTQSSIKRNLKKNFIKKIHEYFAICEPGFEEILKHEISILPHAEILGTLRGGVLFRGPLLAVYSAHLHLRTAGRILLRVSGFHADSYPELYNKCLKIPFEWHMDASGCKEEEESFLKVSAAKSRLHHTGEIERVVTDAVRKRTGRADGGQFYIRMENDFCTVSADLTGQHLTRRGYRIFSTEAPLRESSAAALLLHHRYARKLRAPPAVMDPFAGSGTFLFESFLIDQGIPPGLFRNFRFEKMPWYVPGIMNRMRESFLELTAVRILNTGRLYYGRDSDADALKTFIKNINNLGSFYGASLSPQVFRDLFDYRLANSLRDFSFRRPGLIVTNPPYGIRIGQKTDAEEIVLHLSKIAGRTVSDLMVVLPENHQAASERFLKNCSLKKSLRFRNGGIPVAVLQNFS